MEHVTIVETGNSANAIPYYSELPFYRKQIRIALKNCGIIDPKNINEYIARDGYSALSRALTELTPDDVITVMKDWGCAGVGALVSPPVSSGSFAGVHGQLPSLSSATPTKATLALLWTAPSWREIRTA